MKRELNVSLEETIELDELRAFLLTADLRSVTRAAGRLGLAKSTVSKAISALEERLGTLLLERSSRRIEITVSGQVVLERAREILLELDRLASDVREFSEAVRGALTIAAPPDLGALFASEVFPLFLERYPEVRLGLRLDYGFVDLQDPAIDVGIRIGTVKDDRLVARTVGHVARILVASPRFAKERRLRAPADLARVPALVFSDEPGPVSWTLFDEKKRAVGVSVSGPLFSRNFPVLLRAAGAHLGVALVPQLLARDDLERGAIVRVLPKWGQSDAPVLLVHRVGHQRLGRVRAFLEFFEEQMKIAPALRALRRT